MWKRAGISRCVMAMEYANELHECGMRKFDIVLVSMALFAISGGLSGLAQSNQVGSIAPAPTLVTIDGGYEYLSKLYYQGEERPRAPRSVVVLNFMGLKCAPCRKELPLFLEVMRSISKSEKVKNLGIGIRYFVISTDPLSSKPELIAFLAEQGIDANTEVRLDPYTKAAQKFGIEGLPRTYVIAPDGRIVAEIVGAIDGYKSALRKSIATALKDGVKLSGKHAISASHESGKN